MKVEVKPYKLLLGAKVSHRGMGKSGDNSLQAKKIPTTPDMEITKGWVTKDK